MINIIETINSKNIEPDFLYLNNSIELTVYPRIHMFTFDLSLITGILRHGSFGCSLKNMPIKIIVTKSTDQKDSIVSLGNVQVNELDFKADLNKLRKYVGTEDYYYIEIKANEHAKEHIGIGLSTQILGGIYLTCAKVSGFSLKINDLFKLGIGHFSALGLNLLFNPGYIFEMGVKNSNEKDGLIVNPTLSTEYETPSNTVMKIKKFPFYLIVAIPKKAKSISGSYEIDFWNKSLPDKNEDSYKVVYNVFEKIIPSIVENEFDTFIDALNVNIKLGSKPLEEEVQSDRTKEILNELRINFGFAAVSSLGPALYSFSKNDPSDMLSKLDIEDYTIFVYDQNGKAKKKINQGETLLIASFACMGKTTFAKNNPKVALDIESIHHARIYKNKHLNDEIAKGDKKWIRNHEYPENYIKDVLANIGKFKVIFLTGGKDILSELDKKGIKYTILYPGRTRKNQVLADAHKRGNDGDFVKLLDSLLSTDSHKKSFEDLSYEKFEVIDDTSYIDKYIQLNYIL